MRIGFKNIVNKHKGSPAFVVAHGPSFNPFQAKIRSLAKNGYVIIGINDWYHFHRDTPPSYVVSANNVYTVKNKWQTMNKYPSTTVVYACTIDPTPLSFADQHLKCDYLPYRSRGFGKPELTIQEEVQRHTGMKRHYGGGDTGALHQVALAILLGCNPVYFIGMDLDYGLGYAKNDGRRVTDSEARAWHFKERVLKDLDVLKDSALKIDTKLVNLNTKSTFDTIPIGALPQGATQ